MHRIYKDVDILGIFIENHDICRFYEINNDITAYKNAIALTLTYFGLPFIYYGSEQNFAGSSDVLNRLPLWSSMNKHSHMYTFIRFVNEARQSTGANVAPFTELFVENDVYCYSRGDLLVCICKNPKIEFDFKVQGLNVKKGD